MLRPKARFATEPGVPVTAVARQPRCLADAVMIMLTDHGNGLPDQRIEWIGDDNVDAWIPGNMTLLPR